MTQSKWRKHSNMVIGRTITDAMREDPDMSEKELRRRISAAYPFGERAMHPYKIWCSAVRNWIGKRNQPPEKPIGELPLFGDLP